jgi:hypothetical protein
MEQILRAEIPVPVFPIKLARSAPSQLRRQAKAVRGVGRRQPLQKKVVWRPLNLKRKGWPNNVVSLGPSYRRLQTSSMHAGALCPILGQPLSATAKHTIELNRVELPG